MIHGTAEVEAFDGSGTITVFYATFRTVTAGMPYSELDVVLLALAQDAAKHHE